MKSIIDVHDLNHVYRKYNRSLGVRGVFKNLFNREYRESSALKNISLQVPEGQILGLLGPNGAGKTTLIKILCGLIYPTAGAVKVLDRIPYKKESDFLKQIGVVMGQKSQLIWDISALETLYVIKELYQIPCSIFKERLDSFLDLLEIENHLRTPVRNLSLGERMKFEIIAALIHHPSLLFLDEPTIGLDILSQRSIRDFLIKINQAYKTTIVITSHYMRDIEILCERIVIVKKGIMICDSTVEELKGKCTTSNKIVFSTPDTYFCLSRQAEKISNTEFSVVLNS